MLISSCVAVININTWTYKVSVASNCPMSKASIADDGSLITLKILNPALVAAVLWTVFLMNYLPIIYITVDLIAFTDFFSSAYSLNKYMSRIIKISQEFEFE